MSHSALIRFPDPRAAVLVFPDRFGGTYVVLHQHGWLFGSSREAEREARALAREHDLPIRRAN